MAPSRAFCARRKTVQLTETIAGCALWFIRKGGMIVTTMDVATVSARADSTTFPLLGNMLAYDVTAYPNGFGTRGNGLDLTINGDVPRRTPTTTTVALHEERCRACLWLHHCDH